MSCALTACFCPFFFLFLVCVFQRLSRPISHSWAVYWCDRLDVELKWNETLWVGRRQREVQSRDGLYRWLCLPFSMLGIHSLQLHPVVSQDPNAMNLWRHVVNLFRFYTVESSCWCWYRRCCDGSEYERRITRCPRIGLLFSPSVWGRSSCISPPDIPIRMEWWPPYTVS